jgi:ribosomal-protein-alanine N-acetyltransferase
MISDPVIRLAQASDVAAIARMSRDQIERGLGWGWTEARVLRSLQDSSSNVAVVRQGGVLLGFGIMRYADRTAHLLLLAVHPMRRRRGLASALLAWLEAVARTAAIENIRLEARADSTAARAFYHSQGYTETGRYAGYYRGFEDAVRLEKTLWQALPGKI